MFCIKCGKKIPDGDKFCIFCGEPVSVNNDKQVNSSVVDEISESESTYRTSSSPREYISTVEEIDDYKEGEEQGSSGLKLLLVILIVVLVLLLLVGGGIAVYMFLIDGGSDKRTKISKKSDVKFEEGLASADNEEFAKMGKDDIGPSVEASEISYEIDSDEYEDDEENDSGYRDKSDEDEGYYEDDGIHEYEFFIEDVTWKEARDKCIEKGGYLLHINSQEEYDKILRNLDDEDYKKINFYIGGRREKDKDEYYWVNPDGDYFGEALNSPDLEEYWLEGEPSFESDGKEEKYMDMIYRKSEGRWLWNDIPNNILEISDSFKGRIGYICEYEWAD